MARVDLESFRLPVQVIDIESMETSAGSASYGIYYSRNSKLSWKETEEEEVELEAVKGKIQSPSVEKNQRIVIYVLSLR